MTVARRGGPRHEKHEAKPSAPDDEAESPAQNGRDPQAADLSPDVLSQRWAVSAENARSRSLVGFLALGGLLIYGGGAYLLVASEEASNSHIVLALLAVIVGFVLAGWSFVRRNQARAAFYERQQQAASEGVEKALDELEDVTDLPGMLRFNRSQMKAYESLTREQASSSYLLSHVALGVGLALVIGGGVAALAANGTPTKAAAAGLAAIAVAVSGFLARTYLRIYERTLAQLNYYFNQPLISSYVLTAERLADKMSQERKDDVIVSIVAELVRNIGATTDRSLTPTSARPDTPTSE